MKETGTQYAPGIQGGNNQPQPGDQRRVDRQDASNESEEISRRIQWIMYYLQ